MPEVITCNSSCLIAFESIGRLDILNRLYGKDKIYIPEAVMHDFSYEIPSWIEVATVSNKQAVQMLLLDIGEGEAEAIVLTLEKRHNLAEIEDRS